MRRILITTNILRIADEFAEEVKHRRRQIYVEMLKSQLADNGITDYSEYIDWILMNYDALLCKPLSYFDKKTVPQLTPGQLSRTVDVDLGHGVSRNKFYKHLAAAMGYDIVRNRIYPKYVKRLGIKTCVYCNAQYGVTIVRNGNGFSSTYEIDHFKSQSKAPYLCTSFFNFQPSCSHCNKSKNNKDAKFNLYTEDENALNPFYFSLDSLSLLSFLISGDEEKLSVRLQSDTEPLLLANHQHLFHIDEKYGNHKDEIARLILKTGYYNTTYMRQLGAEFRNIFPRMPYPLEEVVLGFPISETSVHRKPLTLMLQDIAHCLKIL